MWDKITALLRSQSNIRLPWPLVGVVVVVGMGLVLWQVPVWQVPSKVIDSGGDSVPIDAERRAELENEFLKTLAQIMAGVVILVGVFYTARRVAATEKTAEAALKVDQPGRYYLYCQRPSRERC